MNKPIDENHPQEISDAILTGNARDRDYEGNQRGWFIGHFVDPALGLRCTDDVEVKWGEHQADEVRSIPGINQKATTLTLLIKGSFLIEFPDYQKSVYLLQTGDYVIFAPGVSHTWRALENAIVLTVRWPSVSGE